MGWLKYFRPGLTPVADDRMRDHITRCWEMNKVYVQYKFINSGVTSPHIAPCIHLYIGMHSVLHAVFVCLSFVNLSLFSEVLDYSSYLGSNVAIFRMAQISGDPQLSLHPFLSVFPCPLYLASIYLNVKKTLLSWVRIINYSALKYAGVQYYMNPRPFLLWWLIYTRRQSVLSLGVQCSL